MCVYKVYTINVVNCAKGIINRKHCLLLHKNFKEINFEGLFSLLEDCQNYLNY